MLTGFLIPFALIGLLFVWHVLVKRKKAPADSSNRIAHMRLVWFAMTRPELFTGLFPWLAEDEFEGTQ